MSTQKFIEKKEDKDHIQSLEKGLKVIQTFSEKSPTLTISETSEKTGYSRPTARRILLTLEHLGFAQFQNGVFSLTAQTLSLGYAYLSSQSMWDIARPFMQEFVKHTGESSSIAVLDGTDIIYVARVPTKRIMTITLNVGSRLPAYATSMGHVLLAHLSQEELDIYLEKATFDKLTEKTLTTKEQLIKELKRVRERGWDMVEQQLEEGLRSIAAPIKNAEGKVFAAINCSAHAGRISSQKLKEEYLPHLLKVSDKISKGIERFSVY